ncbi:MAG: hypothetical protein JHC81_01715 [Brevundimonas sp.]|uniref:hypothetical protein n=1 Tax=Brevundimonas sp. TaxID=1871086 RepID=UPI001A2BCBCD|nr:hypothetical protein [Brevundimonas sp.]MBJ7446224.1 hypothetical protein [Brevundimonas sp.]
MKYLAVAVTTAALMVAAQPACACPMHIDTPIEETLESDAVVIGYVVDFKSVQRVERPFPARVWQRLLGKDGNEGRDAPALVTLRVAETLAGSVPTTVTADWHNGLNNGPPEEMRGAYLMALRINEASRLPDASAYSVVSGICSGALVFRRGSEKANAIRALFGLQSEPLELPPKTFAESLGYRAVPWPTLVAYGFLAVSVILIGLIAMWPRRRANILESDGDKASDDDGSV